MHSSRNFKPVYVSDKCLRFINEGHLWIYAEEIIDKNFNISDGEIVDVLSKKGRYIGSGFFNGNSKIAVRLLSKNANDIFDDAFFARRVQYAVNYRLTVLNGDLSCCRLIFGESDGFPGLTVDKFNDILVVEVLCLGVELKKQLIFQSLIDELIKNGEKVTAIYERNESPIRVKEGLKQYKGYFSFEGFVQPDEHFIIIEENGIKYKVDYIDGQKTGYFLDQKFNRLAAGSIASGKRVLDCFTHTGAFALNCAKFGAQSVVAVDISHEAIENTRHNIELNNFQNNVTAVQADVFDFLDDLLQQKEKPFDMIILDPPAFTKSKATVKNAYNGYKAINVKAMQLLPRGGYLATCSCSHFMKDEMFKKMLQSAAKDAKVSLKQIEARQQGRDHPILWGVEETDYLKFYIFQLI